MTLTEMYTMFRNSVMRTYTTAELKDVYRRSVRGYLNAPDPLRRDLYLRMSYAVKVELSRRIRFKGRKKSLWTKIRDTFRIANQLNKPYGGHSSEVGVPMVTKEDHK